MTQEILNKSLLKDLKNALGEEVLEALTATYITDATQRIQKVKACFDAGELHELGREAHSLKGASASLGLDIAAQSAEALQYACEKDERLRISQLVPQLTQDVHQAIEHLRSFS